MLLFLCLLLLLLLIWLLLLIMLLLLLHLLLLLLLFLMLLLLLLLLLLQACISNTPTASYTMLQSDECWVSLWWIMAFPHIHDVSHSKLHELGQN